MSTLEDLKYHDPFKGQIVTRECTQAAASELTRLREINKELLEALENLARAVTAIPGLRSTPEAITARAVLDKATGAQ